MQHSYFFFLLSFLLFGVLGAAATHLQEGEVEVEVSPPLSYCWSTNYPSLMTATSNSDYSFAASNDSCWYIDHLNRGITYTLIQVHHVSLLVLVLVPHSFRKKEKIISFGIC
jgi:hypothetical protein